MLLTNAPQIGSLFQVDWIGFGPVTRRVTEVSEEFIMMQVLNGDCIGRIAALTWEEFSFYRKIAVRVTPGASCVARRF